MASQLPNTDFHFYQSANADVEKLRDNFLIRIHEYEVIINDIKKNPMKGSVQHYLLLGRRGSGKSALLKRLEIEINLDKALSKTHIAINLAEEQANIYKLYDLLEEIVSELEYHDVPVEQPEWEEDTSTYARALFAAIHNAVEKSGKKLVLLLDNIDRIFENLHDDASLLREFLLNYDDIKIIGGSTRMTEHFWRYNKPFYEFFRVLELKPLTSEEIRMLLLNWSDKMNLPELRSFVENKPGQLEMVRLLTDGLPRTLLFFVNILLTRTQETGYEYLRLIMDSVTPLYQERLNNLPPSQRKIVLQMAFLWEAVGAKELSEATRMDNKLISAQLKQLIEKGIAEKISTSTKNNLYRLSERFFNLWLIFTQGSPADKRKARCLTIFLENFYDEQELILLASQHLNELYEGNLAPNKAALLTKALAQSRFIDIGLRDAMIDKTVEIENIASDLKVQLPPTARRVWEEVRELVIKKEFKKAIKLADSIEQEDGFKGTMLGYIHFSAKDDLRAEDYLLKASNKGGGAAARGLAALYLKQKRNDFALKYFLIAKERGVADVDGEIGKIYLQQDNLREAKKYIDRAVAKDPAFSVEISNLLAQKSQRKLAVKYLKIGVENRVPDSAARWSLYNYLDNGDKELSLDLIVKEKEFQGGNEVLLLSVEILVKMWAGFLDGIQSKFDELLKKENENWNLIIEIVITNMLIHFQTSLAMQLFNKSNFADRLKENLKPVHYAVTIMAQSEGDMELRIPPEIKETVETIVEEVKLMRKYFYPSQSSKLPENTSE